MVARSGIELRCQGLRDLRGWQCGGIWLVEQQEAALLCAIIIPDVFAEYPHGF